MRIQGERDRDSHIFVLDRDGALSGGIIARLIGDGVIIVADSHLLKLVLAVRGDGLHLAVPGEDGVCRLHVESDGIFGVGVKILPIKNGVAVVDVPLVGKETAAEGTGKGAGRGGGKGFQLVGSFGGNSCICFIAAIGVDAVVVAIGEIVSSGGIAIGKTVSIAGCTGYGDRTSSITIGIRVLITCAAGNIATHATGITFCSSNCTGCIAVCGGKRVII